MHIAEWIEANKAQLIEASDKIWRFAELGLVEQKSADLQAKMLEKAGFTVKMDVADMPSAFVASYGSGKPVIGILGEYDALPGISQDAVPYHKPLEEGAPGHGCGHNLLGTAGVGAVLAVKEAIDAGEVSGTIRYYGCPAEELLTGKVYMVKAGLFDDVDITLTWHPGSTNGMSVASSTAMASAVFNFHGRTAHAAGDPYNGRSALDAVELMNVGANYLREHVISDARIHYVIKNGGGAPNVVPAEATVWYYVRAPKYTTVEEIYARLVKIADGAALMTETTYDIDFLTGCYNTIQNKVVNDVMFEKMNEVGAPKFTKEQQDFAAEISKTFQAGYQQKLLSRIPHGHEDLVEQLKDMRLCDIILPTFGWGRVGAGSTDVGDVSWVTPNAQFSTACNVMGTPGHSWQYAAAAGMSIGHKGMIMAAKIMALSSIEFMQKPELVEKAKEEFKKTIGDNPYRTPIPEGVKPHTLNI